MHTDRIRYRHKLRSVLAEEIKPTQGRGLMESNRATNKRMDAERRRGGVFVHMLQVSRLA